MHLIDRVRRTIRQHALATSSTRIVAALSGGPDSVALVHILRDLDAAGELRLAALAHLNHCLRAAADADERFSVDTASRLGLPIVTERIDVGAAAAAARRSLEAVAHELRYDFFERAAARHGADAVAVGHTRDDQAETVLLRLVRGAGTRGLAGMHAKHGAVIRPLLDCRRIDVRTYLREHGLPFVHDASNDDVGVPRNRVRHELVPLLEERFNPGIVDVLAGEASIAQAEHAFLEAAAADWLAEHPARRDGNSWVHDRELLKTLAVAVLRRVMHHALGEMSGGRLIVYSDVERAIAVVLGELPGFDAPGQRVEPAGRDVVLRSESARNRGRAPGARRRLASGGAAGTVGPFWYSLAVPGNIALVEIGATLSADLAEAGTLPTSNGDHVAVVPAHLVRGGLGVRNRRPGDRLKPSRAGHRKLQDLLVDRKVPRADRDRIPVVVDGGGRIVWVVGHAIDADFRVRDPAQAVVILRFKVVGGSF
jgi:tRNA(Ile)-lysidine synthase